VGFCGSLSFGWLSYCAVTTADSPMNSLSSSIVAGARDSRLVAAARHSRVDVGNLRPLVLRCGKLTASV
jgi:hypothetical protein